LFLFNISLQFPVCTFHYSAFKVPTDPKLALLGVPTLTFVPKHQLGKKLYSHEAIHFFYLEENIQKSRRKIEPTGPCPKSYLFPKGTMVL